MAVIFSCIPFLLVLFLIRLEKKNVFVAVRNGTPFFSRAGGVHPISVPVPAARKLHPRVTVCLYGHSQVLPVVLHETGKRKDGKKKKRKTPTTKKHKGKGYE